MTGRPLRALVIGAGPASVAMHLPALARLRDLGELDLAVICDTQAERATAARDAFGFEDTSGDAAAALARADIDAVYVFGTAQMHFEFGRAALRGGKHLFVEKPIAPSWREACELADAARVHSVVAVGGHNRRFYRAFDQICAQRGKIGWRYAEAVFHKPEAGRAPLFGARTWLGANGIHALDALIYMMGGLPVQLTSFADDGEAGRHSSFSAVMRWADGAQGSFLCNNDAGARREEYAFHAPGETWRVTDLQLLAERNGSVAVTALKSLGDGIDAEHAAFLRAIRAGVEARHAIANLAPSLFLAELIEAGFSGRVELPPESPVPQRALPASRRSILVVQPAGQLPNIAALLAEHRVVTPEDLARTSDARSDIGAAILGHGAEPLSAGQLAKMPQLGIVGVVGLSVARHDPKALLARGISIVNANAAYADGVAEFALGLAILGRRRAFVSHDLMRGGAWGTNQPQNRIKSVLRRLLPLLAALGLEPAMRRLWKAAARSGGAAAPRTAEARELRGAVAGLIGWSANGRAFARLLAQAGVRVIVWSQHAAPGDIEASGATRASLAEVLAADIVSLHRGLTPATRGFLGAAELARLRTGAVLINIARGALIDSDALLARLQRGDVIACLDTFEEEPLPARHPLRALPNVFLTSHIAGGSRDMREAATHEVIRKIAAYLERGRVDSLTPEHLDNMS